MTKISELFREAGFSGTEIVPAVKNPDTSEAVTVGVPLGALLTEVEGFAGAAEGFRDEAEGFAGDAAASAAGVADVTRAPSPLFFDPGNNEQPVPLVQALLTPNRDMALGVTDDGDVLIPKLSLTGDALAAIKALIIEEINDKGLNEFTRAVMTRRVDMVMIGDSTMLWRGAEGWMRGLTRGIGEVAGQWASPIYSFETSGNSTGAQGWSTRAFASGGSQTGTPPSADYDDFRPPIVDALIYTASGDLGATSHYLIATAGQAGGLNVSSRIMYSVGYGTFASGSGAFTPQARLDSSPFGIVATGSAVSTNTGAAGFAVNEGLILEPGARTSGDYAFGPRLNIASVGPTLFLSHRLVDLQQTTGISSHVLYAAGGQSTRDAAERILALSDERLVHFFGELRRQQLAQGEDKPMIWIFSIMGFNDREESGDSVGYDPAVSSTNAGFIDNHWAIWNRLHNIWQSQEWDWTEVHFIWAASHESLVTASDTVIEGYRNALFDWAGGRDRTTVVNWNNFVRYAEVVAEGWGGGGGGTGGSGGTDYIHNSYFFYDAAGERFAAALVGSVE